ncbi:repressor of the inhibitor of the protein kinase [Nymphon striatum]|nr:repressor of the inhibitor of the protein kinase [Nymphon striatum]
MIGEQNYKVTKKDLLKADSCHVDLLSWLLDPSCWHLPHCFARSMDFGTRTLHEPTISLAYVSIKSRHADFISRFYEVFCMVFEVAGASNGEVLLQIQGSTNNQFSHKSTSKVFFIYDYSRFRCPFERSYIFRSKNPFGGRLGCNFSKLSRDTCMYLPFSYLSGKIINNNNNRKIAGYYNYNYSWLEQMKWLVYSKSQNGGYCLPCVLFVHHPGGSGCQFGTLIERPFTNFRKALGKEGILCTHEQTPFHKTSVVAVDTFLRTHAKPEERIDFRLEQQRQKQFDKNKAALSSIVDCIIYLGRQCSALHGHRDDSTADATKNKGNLHALIEFRAKTDENLKIFPDTCPGNARYTITEGLLDFTYVSRGTAAHLVETIKEQLVKCGLKVENVRWQAYNTTAAMSSGNRGLQGLFRRDVPNAIYTPCNSHKLNLVIASASKLQQIKKCITEVNETYLFFNASHKRQGFLERVIDIVVARDRQLPEGRKHSKQHKLKGLCKTRWVARFETIDNFIDLSSSVQTACDIIINPHLYVDDETLSELIKEAWNWDADTKTRAQGILANFGNFEFLVCIVTLRNVLQPLREITARLQKRDLDIRSAYTSFTEVHEDIEALRADIDDRFRLWYEDEVLVMAKELGVDEKVPRAKGRNAYRATHSAKSTMKYFKRSIAIPFIDDVLGVRELNETSEITIEKSEHRKIKGDAKNGRRNTKEPKSKWQKTGICSRDNGLSEKHSVENSLWGGGGSIGGPRTIVNVQSRISTAIFNNQQQKTMFWGTFKALASNDVLFIVHLPSYFIDADTISYQFKKSWVH